MSEKARIYGHRIKKIRDWIKSGDTPFGLDDVMIGLNLPPEERRATQHTLYRLQRLGEIYRNE